MKIATGSYINFFSEEGYDNLGLKVKFDILVVFTESFGELERDVVETLELLVEGRLRDLAMNDPFAKKNAVKDVVTQVLDTLDYDYERIVVEQFITKNPIKAEK